MPIQKSKNTYTRIGDKEDHKRNQIISQAASRRLFEMVYANGRQTIFYHYSEF